ncbi:Slam-dependent surface lipoprotein [Moellerella wisconsensis]|uniref:Slam-dependent surface lipoprotein n=1 Tax=Moellerella wisconsensis TaxID=158849 RepID=UPI003075F483
MNKDITMNRDIKINKVNIAVILSTLITAPLAHAALGFDKSPDVDLQTVTISVGPSEVNTPKHFAPLGSPGIGISLLADGKRIAFQGLSFIPKDGNGIHDSSLVPPYHNNIGIYRFGQVTDEDVYFGDWTYQEGEEHYRNIYYAGQQVSSDLPTEGSATYTTQGISAGYSENGLITGELIADFASNTLIGDLTNAELALNIDAEIASDQGHFKGDAIMQHDAITHNGETTGHFFNSQGSSLAGIATFNSAREYDSSFSGKKQ